MLCRSGPQAPVCTPRASRWRSRPNTSTMHRFVCGSPAVDRETILERDASGEMTTLLLHVAGDRQRYERTIDEVAQVEWWTTTVAEEGFYVLRPDAVARPRTTVPRGAGPRRRARGTAGEAALGPDRQADDGRPGQRPLRGHRGAPGRRRHRSASDRRVRPFAWRPGERPPARGACRGVGRRLLRDTPRGRHRGGGRRRWTARCRRPRTCSDGPSGRSWRPRWTSGRDASRARTATGPRRAERPVSPVAAEHTTKHIFTR